MDPQLLNKPKGKIQNINSKLQKNKIDVTPDMPIFEICKKKKFREITHFEQFPQKNQLTFYSLLLI